MKVLVSVALAPSVMVHVYDPAHKPVAVALVPPDGLQEYAYGAVPPETVTEAEPAHTALQLRFV